MQRVLAVVIGVVVGVLPPAAGFAQSTSGGAGTTTGTIRGVVSDPSAGPLAGATVTARGPAGARSASTGSDGAFAITGLAPGLYQVTAAKGGYQPATLTDLALTGGGEQRVDVTLQAVTLTTLKVIGGTSTSVRGSRSAFNTTPASVASVSQQAFHDQAAPQVMQILDQTPGIVAGQQGGAGNGAAAASVTFANIRGGLAYETATLLDGHPLANVSGFYNLQYLNPAVFQSVEIIKGPGAAAPQINYAIGGSVNFRTLDPTRTAQGDLIVGADSYGGSFSSLQLTGSALHGRLGYALVNAYNGTPGPNDGALTNFPLTNSVNSLNAFAPNPNGGAPIAFGGTSKVVPIPNVQNPQNLGAVTAFACCFPVSDQYFNKSQLVKLRYALSNATTITASYLGSQTTADVEGYHASLYPSIFTPASATASYGGHQSGDVVPLESNLILPGERQTDNEPIFQAELRTSLGNDAILARWYSASIDRFIYGAISGGSSTATFTMPLQVYGTAGGASFNGQTIPVTFQPTGCVDATGKSTSNPAAAAYCSNPVFFASGELDRLDGGSFEYDHFAGPNVYTVSADQSRLDGFSYKPGAVVSVPSIPAGTQ
ncbi:MAG: carboxypeptidase regulatory-like domain-containing protein, partial [Candidatus Eremiobacteraeota bacterium]|nr:carboxypeptidase regulatory-like domain-containing protein [Candidatus Eremiobacteraeota bacterium]